ncbi:MAG: TonB-dependent receptor [Planctomycetia bacterium]|nr:TonB-dependent receptor [Planctomycetia bacterium]
MKPGFDPTAERALAVNLDPSIYGTFAEIGAGQEVARWFFAAGGAAGTVAKTMSAYDMTVSDCIYGKATRYVSLERVQEMLDHEFPLLVERLGPTRGDRTRFFVFADTAAARAYGSTAECHAWLGLRFQHASGSAPSDILVHTRLLDGTAVAQQEALGRLGVNVLHAAFHRAADPLGMLGGLLDDIGRTRLEIDWVRVAGPAFPTNDNRLLALELVRLGNTPAMLFDTGGNPVLAAEALRHQRVLVERGRFAPVTRLNLDLLDRARPVYAADAPAGAPATPALEVMEITTRNLRDTAGAGCGDLTDRIDLLAAVGKAVLVSDLGPFHRLAGYLAARKVTQSGMVIGVPLLQELFDERHYNDLPGGILEAFGRLFTEGLRLYVHPIRDETGGVVTATSVSVPAHLEHLRRHLLDNDLIQPLDCPPGALASSSSDEVRARLAAGDPSWRELVTPEVATLMVERQLFGARPAT